MFYVRGRDGGSVFVQDASRYQLFTDRIQFFEALVDGDFAHATDTLDVHLGNIQMTYLRHKEHDARRRRLRGIITYNVVGFHLLRNEFG